MRVQFGNFFGNTEYPESPRACLASISLSFPKYARACWLIKLAWYQHHYTLIPDKKKKRRIGMRRRIGIRLIMGMSLRMAKGTLMQFNHNDQNEQQFDALMITIKPTYTPRKPNGMWLGTLILALQGSCSQAGGRMIDMIAWPDAGSRQKIAYTRKAPKPGLEVIWVSVL